MKIEILHQTERTLHVFEVKDPDRLLPVEVWTICNEMNVTAILVNGKYYQVK
jgi:hypothetical protein